ncbi:hypothetical protein [Parvibaculum sp.]|uniref:hypothetical protein n=1 Tax=Parvibaculum sp. TaxID=2024848 RepID=UPI00391A52AA
MRGPALSQIHPYNPLKLKDHFKSFAVGADLARGWYAACGRGGMTRFVFKSLMIAGAFLFFGGHLPMPEGRAGGTPAANLQMSLADPEVIGLLDERVVPEFIIAAAEERVAAIAHRFIEEVEAGRR